MGERMSLGQFINQRRKHLHMTQEQLAAQIMVSKSAVAKWETDGGIPDRDNLYSLATALEVKIDVLYRIIDSQKLSDVDFEVNITPDIIALLQSYGYKVIRPGEKEE